MTSLSVEDLKPRSKKKLESVKNELYILVKAKHKTIISIIDHFIINNDCYLIMELATGRSLSDEVKKNGLFDEQTSKQYFAQTSSAINYLNKKMRITHKDLELANFFIYKYKNDQKVIKVTDFGLSRVRVDPRTGIFRQKFFGNSYLYVATNIEAFHGLQVRR